MMLNWFKGKQISIVIKTRIFKLSIVMVVSLMTKMTLVIQEKLPGIQLTIIRENHIISSWLKCVS